MTQSPTSAQVSDPHTVAIGIAQCLDDETELDRCYRQHRDAGGTGLVWNQAWRIARDDRARTDPGWPPDLIDLDDGSIYEWNPSPAGGGEPGYSHSEDFDFAWPRHALEETLRLAALRDVEPAELERLRTVRDDDEPDH